VTDPSEWNDMARTKLVRVLGSSEGELVFEQTLRKLRVQRLQSANDVYRFAQFLKEDGPVVAAVGAMLALSAVIKGANPAQLAQSPP
jgi:hypothetical protein